MPQVKELKELKLLVKQRNFEYGYGGNASMAQLPSYLLFPPGVDY